MCGCRQVMVLLRDWMMEVHRVTRQLWRKESQEGIRKQRERPMQRRFGCWERTRNARIGWLLLAPTNRCSSWIDCTPALVECVADADDERLPEWKGRGMNACMVETKMVRWMTVASVRWYYILLCCGAFWRHKKDLYVQSPLRMESTAMIPVQFGERGCWCCATLTCRKWQSRVADIGLAPTRHEACWSQAQMWRVMNNSPCHLTNRHSRGSHSKTMGLRVWEAYRLTCLIRKSSNWWGCWWYTG